MMLIWGMTRHRFFLVIPMDQQIVLTVLPSGSMLPSAEDKLPVKL
jgi:hypothetical protein